MNKAINVALLGFGKVGQKILTELKNKNGKVENYDVNIKYIFDLNNCETLNRSKDQLPGTKIISNKELIQNDVIFMIKGVSIVIDCLTEACQSYEIIKNLLARKINVITTNDKLFSFHGIELLKYANLKETVFSYGSCIMGNIARICNLSKNYPFKNIKKVSSILDSNIDNILVEMHKNEESYNSYANEHNIKNIDISTECIATKLSELALLIYGIKLDKEMIQIEGIEELTKEDIVFAKQNNYIIKLIATLEKSNSSTLTTVIAPRAVKNNTNFSDLKNKESIISLEYTCDDSLSGRNCCTNNMITLKNENTSVANTVISELASIISGTFTNFSLPISKEYVKVEKISNIEFKYFALLSLKNIYDVDEASDVLKKLLDKVSKMNYIKTKIQIETNIRIEEK